VDNMSTVSRQDLQAVRTATEVERKHNLSKAYADVKGFSTEARSAAAEANSAAQEARKAADLVNKVLVGTADYVVEEGETSSDTVSWTHRKWNSGVAECFGKVVATVDGDNFSISADYPFAFVEKPIVTLTEGEGATAYYRLRYGNIDGDAPEDLQKVYLTFDGVTSAQEVTVYIQVAGRWELGVI
jgi:hypothetical protein